jgi:hypothetical protein
VSTWSNDELAKIGAADELELASQRSDGSLRKPVTIWVVRHGDDLFVRSVYGRGSRWFTGVLDRHEGHISAGGVEQDVRFLEMNDVGSELDNEYRAKYGGRYPAAYVDPTTEPEARAATLKLVPV